MGISGGGDLIGQQVAAASASVVLASDQAAIPVTDNSGSITVDNNGTFAVQAAATLAAETTKVIGTVNTVSQTASTLAQNITANGQTITLTTTGYNTIAFDVGGTFVGTVQIEVSLDGVTFYALYALAVNIIARNSVASFTEASLGIIYAAPIAGVKTFRLRASAWSSGTGTFNIVASTAEPPQYQRGVTMIDLTSGTSTGTMQTSIASLSTTALPTLTKGTQGTTGFSVQQFKDAGRSHQRYYATAVAAGTTTTETAISLTLSTENAATSSAASWIPSNNKKFRITYMSFATRGHSTATAQTTTFNLRMNTSGAVTTTSTPILLAMRSATAAVASAWDRVVVEIPDGMEISGDGTRQWGVTAAATYTTNAPTWDVTIIGYEY